MSKGCTLSFVVRLLLPLPLVASTLNRQVSLKFVVCAPVVRKKHCHSAGNGWDADLNSGPTGRWSTGNFSEVKDDEAVANLDGMSKNYLYRRSCT